MTAATVCFPFIGNLVGGSHISVCGLIRKFDRARFRPLVLLQHDTGDLADLLAASGIMFETAPSSPDLKHGEAVGLASALRLAAGAPRMARFLRQKGVEIVHCNDGRTLATWALPAKLAGAKLLYHHRGSPKAAGLRLVTPLLANRMIAVSHFALPAPGLLSATLRALVIPSPFDTTTVYDRAKARAALIDLLPDAGSATRIIAYSGVMIDRKRPLLFVEAIAALRRLWPGHDVRGVLLGQSLHGMIDRVQDRAILLNVDKYIHCVGFRSPGPFWLAGCDLLMVPAIDEPFGRTLIESMLVGTPVVATASGGNVEAIRDGQTGLLVPPEDGEALAAACLSLLVDTRRHREIAENAGREARVRFGETSHAEAVMALYSEMLGTSARSDVVCTMPDRLSAPVSSEWSR